MSTFLNANMATRLDSWRGGGTGRGAYILQGISASAVPLIVRGAASQSANPFSVETSAGSVLFAVDPSGNLTIAGTITVSINEAVTGNLSLTGSLSVTGTSTLTGAVTMASTLAVTGAVTLTGDVVANHNITVNNNFTGNGYAYFNNPVFISNSTTQPGLTITQPGDGRGIQIDSSATTLSCIAVITSLQTTGQIIHIPNADSLTTGGILNCVSNSSSNSTRALVQITNDNTAATSTTALSVKQDAAMRAVYINQTANNYALELDVSGTTSAAFRMSTTAQTTGNIIAVPAANSLTSGAILSLLSNSGDTTSRNLINLVNDSTTATGATCIRIQQDAAQNIITALYVGNNAFQLLYHGGINITQAAVAAGAVSFAITPGAHTAVVAEVIDYSVVAHTDVITGAYATQRFSNFAQPTISAASSLTVTTAVSVNIDAAPTVASSAVITNVYGLQVGGATTIANAAGTLYAAVNMPAHTITLSTTTQVTSAGPAGLKIGTLTINQSGGAVTVDSASALYIAAAPTAGASVTLTSPYSIWVDAGLTRLDGGVAFAGSGQTTLSNYTEGTFTPTVTLVGGVGNTTPVYSTNTGRYTQIGNRVFVDVYLTGDGGAEGAGTGTLSVAIPTASSASHPTSYFPCGFFANGTAEEPIWGQIAAGGSVIDFAYEDVLNNFAVMTGAEQNNTTRTVRLKFFYEV